MNLYIKNSIKSILSLTFAAAIVMSVAFSCKEQEEDNTTASTLEISEETLLFIADESEQFFTITSNEGWTITTEADWLTVSPSATSEGGTKEISVKASEWTKAGTRDANLVIVTESGVKKLVDVVQSDTKLLISLKTLTLKDQVAGDNKTFRITSSDTWQATSEDTWFTFTPKLKGKGSTTVKVAVKGMNLTEEKRIGKIVVTMGFYTDTVVVVQEKSNLFTLTETAMQLSDSGFYRPLYITASYNWTITTETDWLHIDKLSGGPGNNQKVKVSADKNTTGADREGEFIAHSNGVDKFITVKQGAEGAYWIDGEYIVYPGAGSGDGTGIPVVIIGNGFDREDLKQRGVWETEARFLAELLLNMPIVKDFRNKIDVYIYMAESKERGVTAGDHKFGVVDAGMQGWGYALARNLAKGIPEIKNSSVTYPNGQVYKDRVCILFVGNGQIGGYNMGDIGAYSVGEGNKRYWMIHEFAGHTLGHMPDLYCLNSPSNNFFKDNWETKKWLNEEHAIYNTNVDMDATHKLGTGIADLGGRAQMTDFPKGTHYAVTPEEKQYERDNVLWRDFFTKPIYDSVVGMFTRANFYGSCGDLYHPEDGGLSTMSNRTSYFMSLERFQLWNELSYTLKESCALDDFVIWDTQKYLPYYFGYTDGKPHPKKPLNRNLYELFSKDITDVSKRVPPLLLRNEKWDYTYDLYGDGNPYVGIDGVTYDPE